MFFFFNGTAPTALYTYCHTPSLHDALPNLLKTPTKLALATSPEASLADLLEDCVAVALDALVDAHGGPAWDEAAFDRLREGVRGELVRSEEHTSELQSLMRISYAVFCLKKKIQRNKTHMPSSYSAND